jgi:hypothetical protein
VRKVDVRADQTVTTEALVFDRRSKNFLTFYNTCCGITPGSVGFSLSSFTGSLGSLGTAEAQGEDYCGGGPVGLPATFSSSNPAISTVSSAGDVTGVSPGSTSTNTFVSYFKQKTIDGCTNASQSNSAPTNVKPTISGPNAVWWFNNQTPAGYGTQITLSSSAGSATQWAVTAGSTKVTLLSTTGSSIAVKSSGTAFSSAVGDIKITASANGQTSDPFAITTRKPFKLAHPQTQSFCDPLFGYRDSISYEMDDQLTIVVPIAVSWNEQFTSPAIQDNLQGNWSSYGLPIEVGDTGTILVDNITGPGINNNPPPVPAPVCVGDSTKQQHWGQQFRVGSLTPGVGVPVQTDNIVRFTNHAEHQNVVSPIP